MMEVEAAMGSAAISEIKVVGKSGQISLGKRYAGKTLELQRLEDGSLLLRAVVMVPERQLWTLEEPHRSRIARGLAWAAENEPRESNPSSLLKRAAKRRSRPRARRK
jgi:hypothetical protein